MKNDVKMTNVTIIIPSLNGRHLLAESLPAVYKQTYQDYQVVVIDNGSTDGTVTWLQEHYPEILLIANSENKGFAAAVNQGILTTTSRYIATLNNDVIVDSRWLQNLVEAADHAGDVGMCASKLVFWDNPSIINSSGICVDRVGIVWDRDGGEQDSQERHSTSDVFGPCAGAALYRREMLDEIGLFDEAYFVYFEDVDLAWRARAAGWRCCYVDTAIGRHHHSSTSVNGSRFKNYQLGKNKVRLVIKNYPFRLLWCYVPLLVLYDIFAVSYQLFGRMDFATLQGRWHGWLEAGTAWHARHSYLHRYDLPSLARIAWPWKVLKRFRHLSDKGFSTY